MFTEADLVGALAGLYQLPLGELVAARDQLAPDSSAGAGDRQAARYVAGCGGRRSARGRPTPASRWKDDRRHGSGGEEAVLCATAPPTIPGWHRLSSPGGLPGLVLVD
jgi:hypothetical protein